MASLIEDYALIGDCHTAPLVGRNGSIDWVCFPRFDSGACFAALLGTHEHGRWLISPANEVKSIQRRYRQSTLVLETDYETQEGAVTVVDWSAPRSKEAGLVRLIVGRRGQVHMRMQLVIRFDYGSIVPWVRAENDGIHAVGGPDIVVLKTKVALQSEGPTVTAEFTVSEGERIPFVLMWHPSHERTPAIVDAEEMITQTEQRWQKWSDRCTYQGPWRDAVLRSLITLKALTYAPTGGIVAAVTTSLPEQIGGVRNWDYRYCWLRDATYTLYALMIGGYTDEATAWQNWLLRAAAGDPGSLQTMYGVAGERRLTELELEWLPGFANSRPVRIGNAAVHQFQLDVYGELVDALHVGRRRGIAGDKVAWAFERALMSFLTRAWTEPDEGIWEVRGPRRHFVHSKAMAWVAFDRAIKAVERFGLDGPVDEWRLARDEVHDQICREGFSVARNAF